jgi:hypothetical protein
MLDWLFACFFTKQQAAFFAHLFLFYSLSHFAFECIQKKIATTFDSETIMTLI